MAENVRGPRPRKKQERSGRTRQKLIDATVEVMTERGYAGLTVTEIANRAGVSNGARVHHFATKADLVIAAQEHAYDTSIEKSRQAAQDADHGENVIRAMFECLLDLYFEPFFLSFAESTLVGRLDPEFSARLHPILTHYHRSIEANWTGALKNWGCTPGDAQAIYEIALDTVRGMAMTSMWNYDPDLNRRKVARLQELLTETYLPARLKKRVAV